MDAGEDRISRLPDELLNTILLRLRSTRAAALSRRWRHVWTPLPELFLSVGSHDATFLDTVDAALAACDATPALQGLTIALSAIRRGGGVPAERSLSFSVCEARMLEIVAPRMEKLSVSVSPDEARISAPKLAEVVWADDDYDPCHHRFDDVGRHLRLLELGQNMSLMQQFDEVDELKLGIDIPQRYPCLPSCPCREESHLVDDISLHSLEQLEITSHTSSHEVFELVEQLSKCNAPILKKVVMKYRMSSPPPPTKEVREKIRSMFLPNIEVDFYVLSNGKWVCFD
ncbi:unnamed protein product [Urochloa decumbens]|uniref:F-box domain-containing protein n=1 Tax=Urochloa decumbens TaxID=240449 RepID=A0ABC9ATV3_9POAL